MVATSSLLEGWASWLVGLLRREMEQLEAEGEITIAIDQSQKIWQISSSVQIISYIIWDRDGTLIRNSSYLILW